MESKIKPNYSLHLKEKESKTKPIIPENSILATSSATMVAANTYSFIHYL